MTPLKDFKRYVPMVERYKGIYVVTPKAGTTHGSFDTPAAQVSLIMHAVPDLVAELRIRTIIWDTITTTARGLISEIAREKINRDEHSKHYTGPKDSLGAQLFNLPGINWRDNGMAQNVCRYQIRDPLLSSPLPYNLLMLGHEVARDPEMIVGMDVGGPAAARDFGAANFTSFLHLTMDKGKRVLHTQQYDYKGYTYLSKMNIGPGTDLPAHLEVPLSYEKCVDMWRDIVDAHGTVSFRTGLFGNSGTGKTTLSSAFLGLPYTKPALVIMSDFQPDLPSWWPEQKEVL